ncbi:hypothetical protein [Pedobacter steynii]
MRTPYIEGQGFELADGMFIPDVFIRTIIIILLFYVFTSFLLTLIRILLNHRLKSKMISMEYSSAEVEKILKSENENKNYAMRWFFLLLGSAIGFVAISQFRFGWMSLGILALCIALGYGAYFGYLKKIRMLTNSIPKCGVDKSA